MSKEVKENPDLDKLFKRLSGISRIPKCSGCSCLRDTLKEFREASRGTQWEEKAAELTRQIKTIHGCLGCNPCYPAAISNTIYDMAGNSEGDASPTCEEPFRTLTEPSPTTWPIAVGDYLLGSPVAPVAVSTLGSTELPDLILKEASKKSLAIIGKTETENVGVEKVVLNVVSNPHIRFLVVCGQDALEHFPGQTLLALGRNGMNTDHRVSGTPARRPVLKNLTDRELAQFRAQVTLVDLIGCEDIRAIGQKIEQLNRQNPGEFAQGALDEKAIRIVAHPPNKLVLDKAGFFIVYVDRARNNIILEHYKTGGELNAVLEGNDAVSLYGTAIENGLVGQLDHAAYLGKELAKAELSLKHGLEYVQDAAGAA